MTNDNLHSIRSRMPMSLIVAPLLALLLVFLTSVSHQQITDARSDHGFTGALGYLVVANHTESIRSQKGDNDNSAPDGDGNNSPFWVEEPTGFRANLPGTTSTRPTYVADLQAATHFLTPLLRAPPLA
ncbi:MAG: hypothetical protein JXQ97_09990 [Natronospirillum sp.]